MAFIDLDEMLSRMTGWDLELGLDGQKVRVSAPSNATIALIQTALSGKMEKDQIRGALESAIAPFVSVPVNGWTPGQLVGAATAIFLHAREIVSKNSSSIAAQVMAAMRPAVKINPAQETRPANPPQNPASNTPFFGSAAPQASPAGSGSL